MNTLGIAEQRVYKQSPYADNLLTSYCIHIPKVNRYKASNKSALKSCYGQINKMVKEQKDMIDLEYT